VESAELVAYEDLGAEAIRRLTVKDLPVKVVLDCEGNDLYKIGVEEYLSANNL
jgi:fumarate hydratase subunit beta